MTEPYIFLLNEDGSFLLTEDGARIVISGDTPRDEIQRLPRVWTVHTVSTSTWTEVITTPMDS